MKKGCRFILISAMTMLFCQLSFGQAILQSPTGEKKNLDDLTDEDKHLSQTYMHYGKSKREMDEACKVDETMAKACIGIDVDPKFMGMKSSMVKALAKAYTMVVGSMGGGLQMNQPSSNSSAGSGQGQGQQQEQADNTDYCQYIAVGTEAISTMQQQMAQQELQSELDSKVKNQHKKMLYSAARSHGARAQTAKVQTVGWGSTTVCYTAMMVRPSVSKSAWQNWLKIGSSAFLTAFFKKQIDVHEKYQIKVKAIADNLPGVGDCNPITENDCYCAQPETMNDPKHCLPQIRQRVIARESFQVSCLDKKLKADPKCACLENDNCYDRKVSQQIKGLNFGEGFVDGINSFVKLSKGELENGKLSSDQLKSFAAANKSLKKVAGLIPKENIRLNSTQEREAKAIESLGIPRQLARKMASTPLDSKAKKNLALFKNSPVYNKGYASSYNRRNKRSRVLRFGGGRGLRQNKSIKRNTSNRFNKGRKTASGGKVLKFAKRAQKKAQISKHTGRPLWEIISRRYQVSGWKRLDFE